MSFDPNDFVELVSCEDRTETERLVKKIFASVDTDNSGYIERAEMYNMMKSFCTNFAEKSG